MNEKMLVAHNGQINEELGSMYIYMAMAADLDKMGWGGMAHWIRKQALEEQGACLEATGVYLGQAGQSCFQGAG